MIIFHPRTALIFKMSFFPNTSFKILPVCFNKNEKILSPLKIPSALVFDKMINFHPVYIFWDFSNPLRRFKWKKLALIGRMSQK